MILLVYQGFNFHESQPPLKQYGKRSKKKKRIGHNLLIRLRENKNAVLLFLYNKNVPFTNNQAEQDIRMVKVKQKISGCFRTMEGSKIFCIIRGFLITCRKQEIDILNAIQDAIIGRFSKLL